MTIVHVPVNEADFLALVESELVLSVPSRRPFTVYHPDQEVDVDWDLANFSGLDAYEASQSSFALLAGETRIPAIALVYYLRKCALPLFSGRDWIAYNHTRDRLETSRAYQGGHLRRGFWAEGLPKDPFNHKWKEKKVYELLRSSYINQDYGARPLLVRNEDVGAALSQKVVPFLEIDEIPREETTNYSLVYADTTGGLKVLALTEAYAEGVTVASRAGTYYRSRNWTSLRPTLAPLYLRANGFSLASTHDCRRFHYYLRKRKGTAFEPVFTRVDVDGDTRFWDHRAQVIQARALALQRLAEEQDAEMYVTFETHPLAPDDSTYVTTVRDYAAAVAVLDGLGYRFGEPGIHSRTITLYNKASGARVN